MLIVNKNCAIFHPLFSGIGKVPKVSAFNRCFIVFQIHQELHIKQGKNFGNLAAVKNKKALWFEASAFKLRL